MAVGTPSTSDALRQRQHEFAKQVGTSAVHRRTHTRRKEAKPKTSRLGIIRRILRGDEGVIMQRKR